MSHPHQEEELIQRIIEGDKQLFAHLVDRYKNKVYGIFRGMGANHQDAQDLTQDTFVRIYRYLPTRQAERSFSSWVYTIAVNIMRDHIRRLKPVTPKAEPDVQRADDLTPEKHMLQKEMKREIYRQLEQLPEPYRLVLLLKYTNELSYEEIGEVTGLSAAQIRNALYRGKKSLQKQMKHRGGEWSYEI